MNKVETTFENFLAMQTVDMPVLDFLINLCLTALLAFLLSKIYTKYGKSFSNRQQFGDNFVLVALTTMLIISIVKSSLALSLGLVGALSIVRFRAAIKEPEELAYIFLTIAIGLGFGADQRLITIIAFVFIVGILMLLKFRASKNESKNLNLTISNYGKGAETTNQLLEILKEHVVDLDLKRLDETEQDTEMMFSVSLAEVGKLVALKTALQDLNPQIQISFLDQSGIQA